jgi:hypothetical protein
VRARRGRARPRPVLWEDDSSGAPVARYCRVAPGAETCAATQSWSASGTLGFDADVVREPGTGIVHVLVSFWQQGAAPFNAGAGIYDIASPAPDASDNAWAAPKRITSYTNNATQVGNTVKVTAIRADGARGKTASAKVAKAPAKKQATKKQATKKQATKKK